jgi:hypothetical protein
VSDGKTETPDRAARAGCYFGCNLKRERDEALRRLKELEATIDMLTRHIDDDNADDADLRARLEAYFAAKDARCQCCDDGCESAPCTCTQQLTETSETEAQLRALLAPAHAPDCAVAVNRPMILTMAEIRDLAHFCGFTVDGNGAETRDAEELETEYVIEDCPAQGVMDEDQKTALHYRHVAYIEEYPDEGVMGLGTELLQPAAPPAVELLNQQAREINEDVQRDNGMAEEEEPPKCEECAHYRDASGIAEFCVARERGEALDRGTDGACGPEGRLFEKKGEVKT